LPLHGAERGPVAGAGLASSSVEDAVLVPKRATDEDFREIAILLGELELLRDETRTHMQLAAPEHRERWRRAEMRYVELLTAVTSCEDATLEEVREALMEHRAQMTKLRDDLRADPEC
jgi:hypothetical protein